jgi:ATP-dependent Zn protease
MGWTRYTRAMEEEPNSPVNRPAEMTAAERVSLTATAYHEAGHAVMALMLGRQIQKVSITPANLQTGGRRLGICEMKKGRLKQPKDWLEDEVLILLAGMVAEARFTGEYCPRGAAQDLNAARHLLQTRAGSETQRERLERRLIDKTEHLLSDHGPAKAIELIAKELIERKKISGRAAQHFFTQVVRED